MSEILKEQYALLEDVDGVPSLERALENHMSDEKRNRCFPVLVPVLGSDQQYQRAIAMMYERHFCAPLEWQGEIRKPIRTGIVYTLPPPYWRAETHFLQMMNQRNGYDPIESKNCLDVFVMLQMLMTLDLTQYHWEVSKHILHNTQFMVALSDELIGYAIPQPGPNPRAIIGIEVSERPDPERMLPTVLRYFL
jgi:hypothetical protein